MICKECKNKPIIRGLKSIKCINCSKETIVNYAFTNICNDCSDTYLKCQCCGKELKNKNKRRDI